MFAHHRLCWARVPLLGFGSLLGLGLLSATPVLADCSDSPAPEVDWRACTMPQREFADSVLTKAKLKDGRFTRTDFTGSDLGGIDGRRAKFMDAVLVGASLEKARLSGADFTKADLSKASLKGADLFDAQLQNAVLRGADLTDARLNRANLAGADLSGATWIDGETICAEGSVGQCKRARRPAGEGRSSVSRRALSSPRPAGSQ